MALTLPGSLTALFHSLPHLAISREIIWSLAIFVGASLVSRIHFRHIFSRRDASLEERRQRQANFRNTLILITLGLLAFVWGGEIRSMILSLAAIAAAIMIVSKELISCVYGSMIFTFSKLAKIGDAVEVGTFKGELLDQDWFNLTLMELSDTHYYSGNIVKIPTSFLLTTPLINHSQGGAYCFGSLLLHSRQEHATAALRIAQQAASEICHAWTEPARASLEQLMSSRLTHAPDAEPKATLVSVDKDSLAVSLRFITPSGERASTQALISQLYFTRFESYLREPRLTDASWPLNLSSSTSTLPARPTP